jgi:hypothetical protein
MFRYSHDEFIASKQREQGYDLFEKLIKQATFEHSPEIEKIFDEQIRSYALIEKLFKMSRQFDHPIVMPIITRDSAEYSAMMDLKRGFNSLNKSWFDVIPYIEFSFPEDYNCPYGESFKHVFIFFFTQFKEFDGARDCVLYYLQKLLNLKAFL